MNHLVLVVDIQGRIDQEGLERLRANLSLKKQGRLTDDWDQEFGHRRITRSSGAYSSVGLFRNFDGSWKVQVTDTEKLDPNSTEIASLRNELVEGITKSGYQATVRAKPTFGAAPRDRD